MKSVAVSVLLLMAWFQPVFALDPESVKGSLKVNKETIQLSKAYAHLHDNAEGLLDRPKELRILLADRVVPPGALAGIASLPALEMAREGKLRGLLVQLDPDDRSNIEITLLNPPATSGQAPMTQTLGDTDKDIVQKLEIGAQSVTGEIKHGEQNATASKEMPKLTYVLEFNARLSKEPPVSLDLKGKAAENSPQVKVLREKARALAKLDLEALRKVCTERVNRQNDELRTKAGSRFKVLFDEAAADLEVALESVERVVVRGERAVVISSNQEWSNLVREGKVWKSDD